MGQNIAFSALAQTPTKKLAYLQGNPQGSVYAVPPGSGNSWFVNETTGNDSNRGLVGSPFATLDAALAASIANNGDMVYLYGTSHRTTTLNWNKNGVSLVGLLTPSQNDRARISTADTLTQAQVTAMGTLVNVTAQGCSFVNVEGFQGFGGTLTPPTSPICWAELGGRNFYSNVQFFGGGDSLTAALANMRSLTIGGSGENLFEKCVFGLDTITRATNANATLEVVGASPRNQIRSSVFRSLTSLATDVHILVGASGMDRDLMLDDVMFINQVGSTSTTMNAAISMNASAGGLILLSPTCLSVGATAIATSGNVYIAGSVQGATTTGIAILAT